MKGILMKPDGITATAERRKTVTRRVIKQLSPEYEWEVIDTGEPIRMFKDGIGGCIFLQPRYQVGETVYIKEAWSDIYCFTNKDKGNVLYAIDYPPAPKGFKWHTPFFMPEWAARYCILIKDVRAERLQEIGWDDCLAEGVIQRGMGEFVFRCAYSVPQGAFIELWDSINKDYPWESNLWVFRYEYELQEKEK